MKAPSFWFSASGLCARLLWPLSQIWRLGAALRQARGQALRLTTPVICIGNLTVGGGGKTPMTAALIQRLTAKGHSPHVVSRGYGGARRGPHRVDPRNDTAGDVGDEPLLLASFAPVWVARDRAAGARAAQEAGASIVVLDDGFQNPTLHKDLSILMVDAKRGFGNGQLLPAGPLREPVAAGLARADAIVLVGSAMQRETATVRWPELATAIPAEMQAPPTGLQLTGQPVVAFAGLARPGKFFDTLQAMGAKILRAEAFPDHHRYAPRVLDRLVREAARSGAMLITTEKDAVRLPDAYRNRVMVLPVQLAVSDWGDLDAYISQIVPK